MVQYTEDFLASARRGYENTDQPMRELARELGIGITTLSTLAEKHGWAKRSLRRRGLPPAMQLLAEAQALASMATPPPERGRSDCETVRVGVTTDNKPPSPTLALSGGGSASTLVEEEKAPSLHERLEQILSQLIAAEQTSVANGIRSPQGARTLATLIQAMRALKGMRGDAANESGPIDDDDDMPRDLDEFRHALAQRIEALFARETDVARAGENSGCADTGAPE